MKIVNPERIACVTGASGMIGRRISQRLRQSAYRVRVLTRREHFDIPGVDLFRGGLDDGALLERFVRDADVLVHCAAELHDESKMWDVNVLGTEHLLRATDDSALASFCYISSVGVIGKTRERWVTEETACNPQNAYERSKLAGEEAVARAAGRYRKLILRPTNVIDDMRPGSLTLTMRRSFAARVKLLLKGGESAHIIHAEDIAAAASFLIANASDPLDCYLISTDDEPFDTYADLAVRYQAVLERRPVEHIPPTHHLPLTIPHLMRSVVRGHSNRGDVRYSSKKLLGRGFAFPLGIEGAVRHVASAHARG